MSYIPEIDEGACSGHGDCAVIAPEVFEADEVARVVGDGSIELMLAAAEACPSAAIRIVDERTGEQVFP
jgi:ferredoxin